MARPMVISDHLKFLSWIVRSKPHQSKSFASNREGPTTLFSETVRRCGGWLLSPPQWKTTDVSPRLVGLRFSLGLCGLPTDQRSGGVHTSSHTIADLLASWHENEFGLVFVVVAQRGRYAIGVKR